MNDNPFGQVTLSSCTMLGLARAGFSLSSILAQHAIILDVPGSNGRPVTPTFNFTLTVGCDLHIETNGERTETFLSFTDDPRAAWAEGEAEYDEEAFVIEAAAMLVMIQRGVGLEDALIERSRAEHRAGRKLPIVSLPGTDLRVVRERNVTRINLLHL